MWELLASQKGLAAPLLHKRQFGLFQPYQKLEYLLQRSHPGRVLRCIQDRPRTYQKVLESYGYIHNDDST